MTAESCHEMVQIICPKSCGFILVSPFSTLHDRDLNACTFLQMFIHSMSCTWFGLPDLNACTFLQLSIHSMSCMCEALGTRLFSIRIMNIYIIPHWGLFGLQSYFYILSREDIARLLYNINVSFLSCGYWGFNNTVSIYLNYSLWDLYCNIIL